MNYYTMQQNRLQHSSLCIYDLESQTIEVVANFNEVIEAPQFTLDGLGLIYNSNGKIFEYVLSTGEIHSIPTGEADTCNNDHVLSPNGKWLGVSSGKNGDLLSKIYIVSLETGMVRKVTDIPHSYLHGWSPDSCMLSFCGARQHGDSLDWDVYTVPVNGGSEIRLTDAPGLNDGPEYAPDGKTIWFNSTRSGLMQIWKMNVNGTDQQQVTFDTQWNSWFPHISPDGKKVVYLAYRKDDLLPTEHLPDKHVEIRIISAEGGAEISLLQCLGGQGTMNVNSWSPDSKKFAFVTYS